MIQMQYAGKDLSRTRYDILTNKEDILEFLQEIVDDRRFRYGRIYINNEHILCFVHRIRLSPEWDEVIKEFHVNKYQVVNAQVYASNDHYGCHDFYITISKCEDKVSSNPDFIYMKTLDEETEPYWSLKIQKIEEALGFKLFYWQKRYLESGEFRHFGETTAKILKDLLMDTDQPLDISHFKPWLQNEYIRIQRELLGVGLPARSICRYISR